jgi:hypothetical protein
MYVEIFESTPLRRAQTVTASFSIEAVSEFFTMRLSASEYVLTDEAESGGRARSPGVLGDIVT